MNLYDEITAAGIPTDNHESDLYFPATTQALNILAKFPVENSNAKSFFNQAPPNVGQRWMDVPFAFIPWWKARQTKESI